MLQEHIDNPKFVTKICIHLFLTVSFHRGYAAAEGDARRINPKLRPPVDDRELEIDERTGMKVTPFLGLLCTVHPHLRL